MQQLINPNNTKLALSYAHIPYTSYVFAHCQPTRLHALAKMKGFDPAPVETARVLEIGCSFGGNLIPFAIRYPNSFTVGVDLSEEQVKVGQQMIQQIGLTNLELVNADISMVSFDIKFDYIICHGVFSWVPEFVQHAILDVIRNSLSPNGIAFISYNTYPGWKMKEIAKDFMIFTSDFGADKLVRVDQSFEMMKFTQNILQARNSAIDKINHDNFEHITTSQKNYVAHEYFEEFNHPFYFRQFIDSINQYGLTYITDSSIPTISRYIFKDNQYDDICNYFNKKLENIEQYLDFIENKQFRCSVITHQSNANNKGITNNIDDYFLCYHFFDLYFYIDSFYLHSNEDQDIKEWVIPGKNLSFKSTPLIDSLFNYLQEKNQACKIQKIFDALKDLPEYDEDKLKNIIWTIIHSHNIYLSFNEIANTSYGKKPKISQLYRNWISFIEKNPNITVLANKYYYTIALSPLMKHLIPYLDGTNTMKDLILIVREAFEKELLVLTEDGKKLSNAEISDKSIRSYIKMDLDNLATHGFFNHYQ